MTTPPLRFRAIVRCRPTIHGSYSSDSKDLPFGCNHMVAMSRGGSGRGSTLWSTRSLMAMATPPCWVPALALKRRAQAGCNRAGRRAFCRPRRKIAFAASCSPYDGAERARDTRCSAKACTMPCTRLATWRARTSSWSAGLQRDSSRATTTSSPSWCGSRQTDRKTAEVSRRAARSNSSDKNQLPEMRAAAGAAVAKRAGLQASRVWSVLSVDGCYAIWGGRLD